MRKYDIILFDLDGTLVDSGEGIMRSAQYALSRFGIDVEQDSFEQKKTLLISFAVLHIHRC